MWPFYPLTKIRSEFWLEFPFMVCLHRYESQYNNCSIIWLFIGYPYYRLYCYCNIYIYVFESIEKCSYGSQNQSETKSHPLSRVLLSSCCCCPKPCSVWRAQRAAPHPQAGSVFVHLQLLPRRRSRRAHHWSSPPLSASIVRFGSSCSWPQSDGSLRVLPSPSPWRPYGSYRSRVRLRQLLSRPNLRSCFSHQGATTK